MDLTVLLIFFSMYISCLCVSVLNLFLFDFVIGFINQKKVYCTVLYCIVYQGITKVEAMDGVHCVKKLRGAQNIISNAAKYKSLEKCGR